MRGHMSKARFFGFAAIALLVASPAIAGEHVVAQKNKSFSPADLTIKPGDSVVFKNEDEVVHNVFSITKGAEFNLNMQGPGQSASYTFPGEGKFEIRCVMHPTMKLIVTVKK